MSLKYYPLTRIRTNLYTRGGQFVTEDGKPYSGRYYITYDNKAFTGINPVLGENKPLTTSAEFIRSRQTGTLTFPTNAAYVKSRQASTAQKDVDAQLTTLTPYYPVPLETDYARGYFTRYFAKNVSGPGYIIEISELDWTKIQNGNVSNNVLGYETTSMLWQLTGPLNDTRISQYQIQGGVFTTNKRVTETKQKSFRGIIEFIGGDYTKFAKITSVSVASSGSM